MVSERTQEGGIAVLPGDVHAEQVDEVRRPAASLGAGVSRPWFCTWLKGHVQGRLRRSRLSSSGYVCRGQHDDEAPHNRASPYR